jgi:hypothetical protein
LYASYAAAQPRRLQILVLLDQARSIRGDLSAGILVEVLLPLASFAWVASDLRPPSCWPQPTALSRQLRVREQRHEAALGAGVAPPRRLAPGGDRPASRPPAATFSLLSVVSRSIISFQRSAAEERLRVLHELVLVDLSGLITLPSASICFTSNVPFPAA